MVVETHSPAPTDSTKATTPQCDADSGSTEATPPSLALLTPVVSSSPVWETEWAKNGTMERRPLGGHSRTCSMPPQLPGNCDSRGGQTRSQSDHLYDGAGHDHVPPLRSALPTSTSRQDMYSYYLQSGFPASDC